MLQMDSNRAVASIAGATLASSRAFVDGLVATQERNVEFALGLFSGSFGMLAGQAEANRSATLAMMELAEGSFKVYSNLFYPPVSGGGYPRAGRELPIEDYDRLGVEEIGHRLGNLGVREVERLRAHERLHKNRPTMLERLDRVLV
jgi:hypothetical protein